MDVSDSPPMTGTTRGGDHRHGRPPDPSARAPQALKPATLTAPDSTGLPPLPEPIAAVLRTCQPATNSDCPPLQGPARALLYPATPNYNPPGTGDRAREKSGMPESCHGAGPPCQGNPCQNFPDFSPTSSDFTNDSLLAGQHAPTDSTLTSSPTCPSNVQTFAHAAKRQATSSPPTTQRPKSRKTSVSQDMDVETGPRIPPILMDIPKSWPAHSSTLSQLVSGDLIASCTARTLRLQTSTVAHFRIIQRYLQEQKLNFHTFALTNERLLKVVIKGLPSTLTPDDITEDLQSDGFHVMEAKLLKTKGGRPTSLWLVTLKTTEDHRPPAEIYSLRHIYHCKIDVKKYSRPAGPVQCHRCQGFGHGSSHCHRDARCVRCGGPHPGSLCPKDASESAKCCNCGEAHSANYRGCSYFKKERHQTYPTATTASKQPTQKSTEAKRTAPSNPQAAPTRTPPAEDPEGYQVVSRRRRRAPRNPNNRHHRTTPSPPQSDSSDQEDETYEPSTCPSPMTDTHLTKEHQDSPPETEAHSSTSTRRPKAIRPCPGTYNPRH